MLEESCFLKARFSFLSPGLNERLVQGSWLHIPWIKNFNAFRTHRHQTLVLHQDFSFDRSARIYFSKRGIIMYHGKTKLTLTTSTSWNKMRMSCTRLFWFSYWSDRNGCLLFPWDLDPRYATKSLTVNADVCVQGKFEDQLSGKVSPRGFHTTRRISGNEILRAPALGVSLVE